MRPFLSDFKNCAPFELDPCGIFSITGRLGADLYTYPLLVACLMLFVGAMLYCRRRQARIRQGALEMQSLR